MSISNPSHTLINRNPRSLAHPQLAPTVSGRHHQTSPLPTPPPHLGSWSESADAGPSTVRANTGGSTGSWAAPQKDSDTTGIVTFPAFSSEQDDDDEGDEEDEYVDVHQTFLPDAEMLGRVKVIVGRYEFWCHKEVLWFASPFFKGLLQGSWAETNPIPNDDSPSRTSVLSTSSPTDIDGAVPLHAPGLFSGENKKRDDTVPVSSWQSAISTFGGPPAAEAEVEDRASVYLDAAEESEVDLAEVLRELSHAPEPLSVEVPTLGNALPGTPAPIPATNPMETIATIHSPVLPRRPSSGPLTPTSRENRSPRRNDRRRSTIRHSFSSVRPISPSRYGYPHGRTDAERRVPEAVVQLHEESAAAFQDFLFWAYPHLECKVTWTNVENLLALAMKLLVPPLQKLCLTFLMTHASGRPVIALALAEQYGNADLYREASRFVLDQPTWSAEDMETLSQQTQIKLSQKRTWFLERLLKLGSIDVRKEYQCRPDCPTPDKCQIHLDDKWRQAHSAVSRYGPPQPSVAFRCLRQLETFPTNPSLAMGNPLCQSAAKTWVMTLFDRMFQSKVLPSPSSPGTEKYWLWITLQ